MKNFPTPHLAMQHLEDVAKTVIMPGDPLRAKYIAENFLDDYICINTIRNMLGYTGYYKGKKVSVIGSGMGMPSIGIYAYELFAFYDVETIIRVGSAGSYDANIDLYDLIIVDNAYSESSFAKVAFEEDANILPATKSINHVLLENVEKLGYKYHQGIIHSSDVFYRKNKDDYQKINQEYGCLCVEMESFALFAIAKFLNKNAACILTISDSLVTSQQTTSEERQTSFNNMINLVLESI